MASGQPEDEHLDDEEYQSSPVNYLDLSQPEATHLDDEEYDQRNIDDHCAIILSQY